MADLFNSRKKNKSREKGNRKERKERGREGELLKKELILSRGYPLGVGGGALVFSVFFVFAETGTCPVS